MQIGRSFDVSQMEAINPSTPSEATKRIYPSQTRHTSRQVFSEYHICQLGRLRLFPGQTETMRARLSTVIYWRWMEYGSRRGTC